MTWISGEASHMLQFPSTHPTLQGQIVGMETDGWGVRVREGQVAVAEQGSRRDPEGQRSLPHPRWGPHQALGSGSHRPGHTRVRVELEQPEGEGVDNNNSASCLHPSFARSYHWGKLVYGISPYSFSQLLVSNHLKV